MERGKRWEVKERSERLRAVSDILRRLREKENEPKPLSSKCETGLAHLEAAKVATHRKDSRPLESCIQSRIESHIRELKYYRVTTLRLPIACLL